MAHGTKLKSFTWSKEAYHMVRQLRWLSLWGLMGLLSVGPVHANDGWVPNMVNYINGSVIETNSWLDTPTKSSTGVFSISWAEQANDDYLLEYQTAGNSQWVALYTGSGNYYVPTNPFNLGEYAFRLGCSGEPLCPEDGYVTSTTAVVPSPAYVNSVFMPESDVIQVYWGADGHAQGHVLEQSTDNGNTWQEVTPTQNTVVHQSDDYDGLLHGDEDVTLSLAQVNASAEMIVVSAKSKFGGGSAKNTQSSFSPDTEFRYRVKTCVSSACSEYSTSKILSVDGLTPIFPDAGFESGISDFYVSEGGGFGQVTGISAINLNKSYQASLEYWGDMQLNYPFDSLRYLNGVSLTGKLRLTQLSAGSRLSVYAVAYYDGIDNRVEGTRYELTSADVSSTTIHDLYSTLYLDETRPVKYVRYIIRLLGGGTAEYTLDDAQMYEGTYLGQSYPVLTSYLSNYSGANKVSWSAFANSAKYEYHVQYQKDGDTSWNTFYKGRELEFSNPETDMVNNPKNFAGLLDSGIYHFRIYCGEFGDCPNGYAYATLVEAREPEWLTTNYNIEAGRMGLAWAETISAYGYLVEEKYASGEWVLVSPTSEENSRLYQGNLLFTDNYTKLYDRVQGVYQYRVRACRSSGCTGEWRTSEVVTVSTELPDIQFYSPITKYNGYVDTNWTAFKAAGQTYKVEIQPEHGQWTTWYQGTDISYTTESELASGMYHFRIGCAGVAGCLASGYVESFTLVVRAPAYLSATYNAGTFDVSLNWSNTIDAFGYVLEHKVNNGVWRELTPKAGEASYSRFYPELNAYQTMYVDYSTTITVNQSGTHYFRVKACRSSRCGSYIETLLDAQVVTLIQWAPATVTVGQQAVLIWDSAIVSQCESADSPAITLVQSQTAFYEAQENELTAWNCVGLNAQTLGQFTAPITANKLQAPNGLKQIEE
jgi:hypothetical protein